MNILDLVINEKEPTLLEDVRLSDHNRKDISALLKEHQYIEELSKYGLPVNNKLFLYGSSGCGKTMTAKAIAQALKKPLLVLNLSNIVCSKIGETAQNLKLVFDKAAREKAVLFLDEFDHIGKSRAMDDTDVGEMKRLVNTLLQLIDYFPGNSLLIAATNHIEVIDHALLRRFQLRIGYQMPAREQLDAYYDELLSRFPPALQDIDRSYDISYAEAKDTAMTQVKSSLIAQLESQQERAFNIDEGPLSRVN